MPDSETKDLLLGGISLLDKLFRITVADFNCSGAAMAHAAEAVARP
jgi:hypothetical protein